MEIIENNIHLKCTRSYYYTHITQIAHLIQSFLKKDYYGVTLKKKSRALIKKVRLAHLNLASTAMHQLI